METPPPSVDDLSASSVTLALTTARTSNDVDDSGSNKESLFNTSLDETPGRQGESKTGGIKMGFKVLLCSNMSITVDYEQVHLLMKPFGEIVRIRLRIDDSQNGFNCYVVYEDESSANKASDHFNGHSVNDNVLKTRLFHIDNFKNDPLDYFPENVNDTEVIERLSTPPEWFVASYKEDQENLIKGMQCIRKKVGTIPDENIKRYGRTILVKAGNRTQSFLLLHFKASEEDNIGNITPHKSFNNAKGIIYSKDLYEFSDEEIFRQCPANVWAVKKLPGLNNAILITFYSSFLPDYVKIWGLNFGVKKLRPRPTQCRKCFEFGHVSKYCNNIDRCFVCSGIHDLTTICTKEKYCFNCKGNHSPNWRQCPIYKYHQDVLEMAENERISIGSVRRKLRKFPNTPTQTFSSALKSNIGIPNNSLPSKSVPVDHLNEGIQKSVVVAEIHHPPAEKSKHTEIHDPSVKSKVPVKPKSKTFQSDDSFWSPPKTKKSRPSSPQKWEIKTSNKFDVLDPFGKLYTSNPLKKIALASSHSTLDKMDSSDPNLIRSKSVEELNKSKEKIHQNPNPQKNAKEKIPSITSFWKR